MCIQSIMNKVRLAYTQPEEAGQINQAITSLRRSLRDSLFFSKVGRLSRPRAGGIIQQQTCVIGIRSMEEFVGREIDAVYWGKRR